MLIYEKVGILVHKQIHFPGEKKLLAVCKSVPCASVKQAITFLRQNFRLILISSLSLKEKKVENK